MLYALLNGGIPYVVRNAPYDNVDGNFGSDGLSIEDRIQRANIVLDFYQRVKNEEMIEHKIINDHVQQAILVITSLLKSIRRRIRIRYYEEIRNNFTNATNWL